MLTTLFLFSVMCLAYTYVGYPLLLHVVGRRKARRRRPAVPGAREPLVAPSVSVIVAAHNEAATIGARVQNLLAQAYPRELLEVIVGSDGSTDETVAVVAGMREPRVRTLDLPRRGRALVHNACAAIARGDLLVFTDAGTQFAPDCLRRLVAPFSNPHVGCTSGHLVYTNATEPGIARCAGWYWRYELLLRRLETAVGSTVAVTGACMAMRRNLFLPLAATDDVDDAAPVDVLLAGYQVLFLPDALAYDRLPAASENELAARQRIVTKSLTAVVNRPKILSPHLHPAAAAMLISHRVMRYLSPVFLVILFLTNALLLGVPLFRLLWGMQLLFYSGAALGFVADRLHRRVPVLSTCFALCLANIGFLLGVFNIVRGRGIAAYEPVR